MNHNSYLENGETPDTLVIVVDVTEDDGRTFTWNLAEINLREGSLELCSGIDLPGVDKDGRFNVAYLLEPEEEEEPLPTDMREMTLVVEDFDFFGGGGVVQLSLQPEDEGPEFYLADFSLGLGLVHIYNAVFPLQARRLIVK